MTPVRLLARPLLASVFVSGGIDILRNPGPRAEVAEPVTDAVSSAVNDRVGDHVEVPQDPELLTRVNGGVMVGAGLLLALGKLPRLSSVALAATIIPTTFAAHRFWEIDDEADRAAQQVHFMKNMGILGGLALAAVDTEGRPGLARRAGQATDTARRETRAARRIAKAEGRRAGAKVAASVAAARPGS